MFPRLCILMVHHIFLKLSLFSIKSWGWKRLWGHWVQLLLSKVLLIRICIFTVIPPTEAAFALRFSSATCTKQKWYHFHFLKSCQQGLVRGPKKQRLFIYFAFWFVICVECSLSYFNHKIGCLKTNIFVSNNIMVNNNINLRAQASGLGFFRMLLSLKT